MSLLVIVLYVIAGSSLFFSTFVPQLQGQLRNIVGVVCIVYGAFRFVRWMQKPNSSDDTDL